MKKTSLSIIVIATLSWGCAASQHHRKIEAAGEALRFELAQLYIDKGVQQAAVPLLQKMLHENPKDIAARVLYANVLRDLGLYPQAEREYRFVLQLEPRLPAGHAGLGILLDLQHKSDEAIQHHLRAVRLVPGNAAYRNNLGFSLYLAGNNDKAIVAFEQALAMDPGLAVAYNNLAFAYGRKGDFERAERTFKAGLGEAQALINMAMVYDEHGDNARADELRDQAYRLDPDLRPIEKEEIDL